MNINKRYRGRGEVISNVNIQGVTKRYHQAVAVDDVNIDIREGEFLTLLGPSGSGKTTLLMIIAGFIEPVMSAGSNHTGAISELYFKTMPFSRT
jgi:ABC-type multidrug transport system ATPase subunit